VSGLPRRCRGRQNRAAEAAYQADLEEFCARIRQIKSRLDFQVGTRGWCYLLEGERVIDKGEFDACERLITCCRKDGNLPIDICAEDNKRAADGVERLDYSNIEAEAEAIFSYVENAHLNYTPFSFWAEIDVYVEIATEKSDLKSLFSRVASPFHVVIQNVGGWADLNVRAGMMRRFHEPVRPDGADADTESVLTPTFLRCSVAQPVQPTLSLTRHAVEWVAISLPAMTLYSPSITGRSAKAARIAALARSRSSASGNVTLTSALTTASTDCNRGCVVLVHYRLHEIGGLRAYHWLPPAAPPPDCGRMSHL
jgi:hypothetical protein